LPALFWASSIAKSILMVGYVQVVVAFIFGIIGLYIGARLLQTSFGDVLNALRPAVVSGFFMGLIVIATLELRLPSLYQLIVSVLAGMIVYLSLLLKFEPTLIREVQQIFAQYRTSAKVSPQEIGS
jgi:hypothetical protein